MSTSRFEDAEGDDDRCRILVVEDEAVIALDLQSLLEEFGHEVVGTASRGDDALRVAAETRPDLALLDIRIGGRLDGIEVACRLRRDYDIPTLFLSAFADEETVGRAKRAEPVGFLLKPVDPRALRTTLETALYVRRVTRQKLDAHRQRALADERLAAILQSTHDAVVSSDDDGRIIVFNRGAESTFGYEASEVLGRPLELLLPASRVARHRRHLATVRDLPDFSRPMASRPELEGQRKNGERFPIEVSLTKITHDDGPVYTAIARDVTERRELQRALIESQKREAVARIANGIAHDFNNVLAVFMGLGALIMEEADTEGEVHKWAGQLLASADRARSITRELMLLQRSKEETANPIDLSRRVARSKSFLERVAGDTVQLHFDFEPGVGAVRISPGHLEQIMLNLVVNARDAMPEGGTITVRTYCEGGSCEGSDRVVLEVSDTGVGMDQETLERATDLLFTTKPAGGGTGLGLYTVNQLAQAAKGELELESELHRGATVRVKLPRVEGPLAKEGGTVAEVPARPRAVQPLSILVADPNDAVREAAGAVLSSRGHRVQLARSSPEAMVFAEQHPDIRVLVADVHMSYVNGLELALRLRKHHSNLHVILTASACPEWIENDTLRTERIDFLLKPYSAPELLDAVVPPAVSGASQSA